MAKFLTITFFGGLILFVISLIMIGIYSLLHEKKAVPVILAAASILLAFFSIFAYQNVPKEKTKQASAAAPEVEQSNDDASKTEDKSALQEQFNKSVSDGVVTFSKSVQNDETGNWRMLTLSSSKNVADHALDYYKAYFQDDNEIHFIVNLGLKTTTMISAAAGQLFVDVHEYVDKEEHDAKILGSGMILKQYMVNIDTGEVTDLAEKE